ncbi:MAG: redoxin domain-containing protein [Acidobacteria bacterium]|nr:redoxin domain-containing protein [Acidobacteriota bacterium]
MGDPAPDFTLTNHDRQPVRLSEEWRRGSVVLTFFPAAFSRVCTAEMCSFRDSMNELRQLSAVVLGVSTDSFFALKAWRDALQLDFPLLSDFNKDVVHLYNVYNVDLYGMRGTAMRAVFVVDTRGIIRERQVLDDVTREPDYEKVRSTLASL